jgi:hypothetical protein
MFKQTDFLCFEIRILVIGIYLELGIWELDINL